MREYLNPIPLLRKDAQIPALLLTYFINDSSFLLISSNVKHTSFNPMFCFENCFYSYKNIERRKTLLLINIGNCYLRINVAEINSNVTHWSNQILCVSQEPVLRHTTDKKSYPYQSRHGVFPCLTIFHYELNRKTFSNVFRNVINTCMSWALIVFDGQLYCGPKFQCLRRRNPSWGLGVRSSKFIETFSQWKGIKWYTYCSWWKKYFVHILLSASSNVTIALSPFAARAIDDTSPPPCLRCWKWITSASSLVPGGMLDTTILFKILSLLIFPQLEPVDAITYSTGEKLLSLEIVRLNRVVNSVVGITEWKPRALFA